jgi:hypothetical protein
MRVSRSGRGLALTPTLSRLREKVAGFGPAG